MNKVEVELDTVVSGDGSTLGLFVYHGDPDGRIELEEALFKLGGEFVPYPDHRPPARIGGGVTVTGSTVSLFAGPLHIVGALETPLASVGRATRAIIFVLHEPFNPNDKTERALMAATLPLSILEREEI